MPAWGDEEEPNWEVEEVVPEPQPAAGAPAAAGEKKEGEAPADGAVPAGEEAPIDPDAVDPKKFNRHWVRPKFLQYSYMYDYRKNYYDDVIDFLDRRQRGVRREIPRPQTWAERVLRTYNQKLHATETAQKTKTTDQIISSLHHSRAVLDFRTKDYYHSAFTIAY